jgi:hypothetical protein
MGRASSTQWKYEIYKQKAPFERPWRTWENNLKIESKTNTTSIVKNKEKTYMTAYMNI